MTPTPSCLSVLINEKQQMVIFHEDDWKPLDGWPDNITIVYGKDIGFQFYSFYKTPTEILWGCLAIEMIQNFRDISEVYVGLYQDDIKISEDVVKFSIVKID